MKNTLFALAIALLFTINTTPAFANGTNDVSAKKTTLKEAFDGKFLIGTAADIYYKPDHLQLAATQFNVITPENGLKMGSISPNPDQYNFFLGDKLVEFAEKNKMQVIGHALIWHSQLPKWFCTDENGKDLDRETLLKRMEKYIHTTVGHFKGRIRGWDVVNEAIEDDGSWRKSKFYQIIGPEYIRYAFQYAHEADPNAELYYNDYGMTSPRKRETVLKLIKTLKDAGLRIDAVGMQCHLHLEYPAVEAIEKSIIVYSETGVKVNITELDCSALPSPRYGGADVQRTEEYQAKLNPYTKGLPEEVSKKWNNRMKLVFDTLLKHSDKIDRVTVWGITDQTTWLNSFPIRGRTDYPLLFDRNMQPKPFLKAYLQKTEAKPEEKKDEQKQ